MFLTQNQKFFCVPGTKFVSATNVARPVKRGNICVGNNVSATMCPRLPVALVIGEFFASLGEISEEKMAFKICKMPGG